MDDTEIKFDIPDSMPDDIIAPELVCEVCGTGLTYGGRGRKPRFCDEHKPTKSAGGTKRVPQAKNAALAAQAAQVLVGTNALVAFVARMGALTETADQIDIANDPFRDRAYEALLADPELCRTIIKGGGLTGKAQLTMAYAMFAFAVVPVATSEIRERRAAAIAAREE